MAGNITVINPSKYFQQISRAIIRDDRIDALTLGLFVKIVDLSDKWQLNINGLSAVTGLSREKITTSFKKLEKAGYMKRVRVQADNGRFIGWDYTFYNLPTDIGKNRQSENTDIGKNRQSENQPVYKIPEKKSETVNKGIRKVKTVEELMRENGFI